MKVLKNPYFIGAMVIIVGATLLQQNSEGAVEVATIAAIAGGVVLAVYAIKKTA